MHSHVILSCYHRISADRDYSKITAEHCCRVVTHYGRYKFGKLTDLAVGPNDEVIIVDNGNQCVVVLDSKLNFVKLIGQSEIENSRLFDPYCVAVTDNVIVVTDLQASQVKKYSLQGAFLSVIGNHGNNNGQFFYPSGLVFSSDKLLYVVDRMNFRVQVFKQDDTFAFSFGTKGLGPGQFNSPLKIAIDLNNNLLVSDRDNSCIQLFSCDGRFIKKIDCFRPFAIAISPTGYVITGHDDTNDMITIWSPTHQLVCKFGKRGSQQGDFCDIKGMSIGPTGEIYVAEERNRRFQVVCNNNW